MPETDKTMTSSPFFCFLNLKKNKQRTLNGPQIRALANLVIDKAVSWLPSHRDSSLCEEGRGLAYVYLTFQMPIKETQPQSKLEPKALKQWIWI